MSRKHVGFCGSGIMGTAIIRRLLSQGYEVTGWNRSKSRIQGLADEGVNVVEHPVDMAECDILMLCLTDETGVESVAFGPHGFSASGRIRYVVDHSTISPEKSRLFADRVMSGNGATWIDAPVTGGADAAREGKLTIFAGGPEAGFRHVKPHLLAYAKHITHLGPTGSGQRAKLCNQSIAGTTIIAIAEALSLAKKSGIDPHTLLDAMRGGLADSILLNVMGPRFLERPDDIKGTIATLRKDFAAIEQLAANSGCKQYMAAGALEALDSAISRGLGEADLSFIIAAYE